MCLYVEPVIVEPTVEPIVIEQPLEDACFCVKTARKYSHFVLPRQDAQDFIPNSPPVIGGLVLLRYGDLDHVAVTLYIMPGGVWVREGNYNKCAESERFIAFDDPHLLGFWSALGSN